MAAALVSDGRAQIVSPGRLQLYPQQPTRLAASLYEWVSRNDMLNSVYTVYELHDESSASEDNPCVHDDDIGHECNAFFVFSGVGESTLPLSTKFSISSSVITRRRYFKEPRPTKMALSSFQSEAMNSDSLRYGKLSRIELQVRITNVADDRYSPRNLKYALWHSPHNIGRPQTRLRLPC